MNKGTMIKYGSIVAGAIVAIVLFSNHPVPIILLGICAGVYFLGEAIENGKIKF